MLVEGGQEALKEALLTKGPMIVSSEWLPLAACCAALRCAALLCAVLCCAVHAFPTCLSSTPPTRTNTAACFHITHPPSIRPTTLLAVDASDDAFRFYSGGLYTNPQCATAPADLDHAVIIRWVGHHRGGWVAGCGSAVQASGAGRSVWTGHRSGFGPRGAAAVRLGLQFSLPSSCWHRL